MSVQPADKEILEQPHTASEPLISLQHSGIGSISYKDLHRVTPHMINYCIFQGLPLNDKGKGKGR